MTPAILVTGGAGYVGSHTVTTLLERQSGQEFEIVVVDNLSNAYRSEGQKKPESLRIIEEITNKTIHFYELDIRDAVALSKVFETVSWFCLFLGKVDFWGVWIKMIWKVHALCRKYITIFRSSESKYYEFVIYPSSFER